MKDSGSAAGTRVVLIVEYDGTNYHGSQLQVKAPTIQGELEKALHKLTRGKTRIKAASRTDAGVHAKGQVVSFNTDSALPLTAFVNGLNHYLPRDIAVKEAFRADNSFDARRSAISREYKYYILNSPTRSPIRQDFSCRVTGELDIGAMNQACQALIGKHDFASFISSPEMAKKNTVRNIYKAAVEQDGDMIVFDIVANSFLPHQVRNTMGSLFKVGQGKMTVDEFFNMVKAERPGLAGPTAPAGGLCLMRVNYPRPFGRDAS
ncbi:tRNA pseudouridine(38-40) synthase TruA [Chloroflexota bacterium]